MAEDLLLSILHQIFVKAQTTPSKTEKIKYIHALLVIEECSHKYSQSVSEECRKMVKDVINNWKA